MPMRIKELRDMHGWTQEVLAAKAGMSRSQLAMIERETRPANTRRLAAIADAMGVPTEALFAGGSQEWALVQLLKRLDPDDRAVVVHLIESLARKTDPS